MNFKKTFERNLINLKIEIKLDKKKNNFLINNLSFFNVFWYQNFLTLLSICYYINYSWVGFLGLLVKLAAQKS